MTRFAPTSRAQQILHRHKEEEQYQVANARIASSGYIIRLQIEMGGVVEERSPKKDNKDSEFKQSMVQCDQLEVLFVERIDP